jgi:hypothetical protein
MAFPDKGFMVERRDIEFEIAGHRLRGWLFVPKGTGPFAAISIAHRYAGGKKSSPFLRIKAKPVVVSELVSSRKPGKKSANTQLHCQAQRSKVL